MNKKKAHNPVRTKEMYPCEKDNPKIIFPLVTWWGWRTPSDFYRWVFGQVMPIKSGDPAKVKNIPINWNTLVVAYELP